MLFSCGGDPVDLYMQLARAAENVLTIFLVSTLQLLLRCLTVLVDIGIDFHVLESYFS